MKKFSLKSKLLVLTVGLNFISFVFCAFMMTQVKGALNNSLFWVAQIGLFIWACVSFWYVSKIAKDFTRVIAELVEDSTQMKTTVSDINNASGRLAQATTEQAAALQETAASIEEMNAMIKKSAESATRSRNVATTSYTVANQGKSAVDEMLSAIQDIHQSNQQIMKAVDDSNTEFSEIIKVIAEIANKTKIINDIVFQTKLLSFNASVEAARAGEHGKGFAVVAEEVGSLAQMSGNAAKEISDMLQESMQKVEGIVNGTRDKVSGLVAQGRKKVDVGTSVAKTCGQVLEEVVKNVTALNMMVDDISTASNEQSQGISEITRAINQLDQVTHSNAMTSQQTASAATQLDTQADSLKSLIVSFSGLMSGNELNNDLGLKVTKKRIPRPEADQKVVEFKKRKSIEKKSSESHLTIENQINMNMASGGDSVPDHDDPRFKDV